eukprot:3432496-Amphidinium_carterae.1
MCIRDRNPWNGKDIAEGAQTNAYGDYEYRPLCAEVLPLQEEQLPSRMARDFVDCHITDGMDSEEGACSQASIGLQTLRPKATSLLECRAQKPHGALARPHAVTRTWQHMWQNMTRSSIGQRHAKQDLP